jgi:hypothetical protein
VISVPVPGKHDEEPRTEIQGDLYAQWVDARNQAVSWGKLAADLRAKLEDQMGDSTGGLIHGRLVVTYRYKDKYAVAALIRDNPALTEHYMKTREVQELDIDTFARIHPEIVRRYRVREFRVAGDSGEGESNGA